jgi:hypothetical protein
MKKFMMCVMTAVLLLACIPTNLKAATASNPTSIPASKTPESVEAKVLHARLDEINGMNKSNLTSFEKKELRTEKRAIKKNLKQLNGGVYLSAGAIILIIVLIVILL